MWPRRWIARRICPNCRSRGAVTEDDITSGLEDANSQELGVWTDKLVEKFKTLPELTDVASDQQLNGLEAHLVIDRDTASRLGITPQNIDDALDES